MITHIPGISFDAMCRIASITLPVSVKTIGDYAFVGTRPSAPVWMPDVFYRQLKTVNAPGVTRIGWAAFANCIALENVNMPEVIELNGDAFNLCINLIDVDFPKVVGLYNFGNFERCEKLERVNMPMLEFIGPRSFGGCNSLSSISLGTISDENFGNYYFQGEDEPHYENPFPGNLRDVYLAPGGGAGTYVRILPSTEWTKQ